MKLLPLIVALWLFADPFWIEKAPRDWTPEELASLASASPWGQMVPTPIGGVFPPVQMFLATAGPIQDAEAEAQRRAAIRRPPGEEPEFDPFAEEYRLWLEEFGDSHVILAVRISDQSAYFDGEELERFEEESTMRLGGRKVQMTGYFPPWSRDPYLRVAFPKDLNRLDLDDLDGEKLEFDLYLPGISGPFREADFRLEDMLVDGELEM